MKYKKYFSILTKENGQQNLNIEQFRCMMNIFSIEGIINGMSQRESTIVKAIEDFAHIHPNYVSFK